MRVEKLLIGAVCMGFVLATASIGAGGSATAVQTAKQGDWADSCEDAQTLSSGKYNGTLTPDDVDYFQLDLGEGNYAAINFSFEGGGETILLGASEGGETETGQTYSRGSITAIDGGDFDEAYDSSEQNVSPNTVTPTSYFLRGQGIYAFRLYSEGDNPVCFRIQTDQSTAVGWKMTVDTQNATAPPIDC